MMFIHSYYWTLLLLGGGDGKGVSLVVGALLTSSATESVSSSLSSATALLESDGMGGDGAAAEIVEPSVEEQRWLEQQRQDNITNTTATNNTINNDTSLSVFEGIVVVVIESSFNNAIPEEIIQFQNDFRYSYNLVNGIVGMISDENVTNTTNNNNNSTNDPFRREIINVTLEYNFTFTPGLSNVPINEVRHERELVLRDLELFDDITTPPPTSITMGNTSDTNTTNTTITVEVPTYRFIQVALFVSAICTRCPSDVVLFDDVSNSETTTTDRRQLKTINKEKEEKEEDDTVVGTATTKQQQGPNLDDVLSVLQTRTTFDIPALLEVEGNTCPSPSNMYFTEIYLELTTSDYSVLTSQDGQDVLTYLFRFIFNDLSQKNFCDPLYRTIMNVQIDDVVPLDVEGEDQETTVVGTLFLVEVHCLGVDCEQNGHDLFDNDNSEPQQRHRRSRSVLQASASSSSLSPEVGYPSLPSRQLRATSHASRQNSKEAIPSWITSAKRVPTTSSTTTTTTTTTTKGQSLQQKTPMKSNHRALMDDTSSPQEDECYCPVNAIGNRAPTRSEFLKVYQPAVDGAIDATPAPSNVPTTAPSNAPTTGPTNAPSTPGPTTSPTLSPTDAVSLTLVSVSDEYVNLDFSFNPNTELDAWIGFWPVGSNPRDLRGSSRYWIYICSGSKDSDCKKHPTSGSVSMGYEFINGNFDPDNTQEFEAFLIESSEFSESYDSIAQSESFIF